MESQLKALEAISRKLEPSQQERSSTRNAVDAYLDEFINSIEQEKAFKTSIDQAKGLYDFPISEEPIDISQALNLVEKHVDGTGLNPASGGHLAYIPGGGISCFFGLC